MNSSFEMGETFTKARQHWRCRPTGEAKLSTPVRHPKRAMAIAVSRERGAQGSQIAREVAARSGWAIYDRELIAEIAQHTGLREELLASVDERETSWLTDCLEALKGQTITTSTSYVHQLSRVLAALSAHGNCVIVGRGAVALLPRRSTLCVNIVAPLPTRISQIQEEMQLSEREAKRHIETTDRMRREFVKNHFHKDIRDPHLYDVMVNSTLGVDACVALIAKAIELKEARSEKNQ